MPNLTQHQAFALAWLACRGADGLFDLNGVVIAQGARAPVMRATWNKLRAEGLVEFYNPKATGRGRLRLTTAGQICPAAKDWRLLEQAKDAEAYQP